MAVQSDRNNVTEMVYSKIYGSIISGDYQPGDRIASENELAEMYGVSRNTIRMALNRLSTQGLIEIRRGDGSFVKKVGINMYLKGFIPAMLIHEDSLMDLMEFRRGIEITAARLAAIRAEERDIKQIREILRKNEKSSTDVDHGNFAQTTLDFHSAVVHASHNEILIMMFDVIQHILSSKMKAFLEFQKYNVDSPYYHKMVYETIALKDMEGAQYFMKRHMDTLIERVNTFNEYVKEHPDHGFKNE